LHHRLGGRPAPWRHLHPNLRGAGGREGGGPAGEHGQGPHFPGGDCAGGCPACDGAGAVWEGGQGHVEEGEERRAGDEAAGGGDVRYLAPICCLLALDFVWVWIYMVWIKAVIVYVYTYTQGCDIPPRLALLYAGLP